MIKPTIHRNGTSADSLADAYSEAGSALHAAIRALEAAGPNARDYYVQGPTAYNQAAKEHADRILKVKSVLDDIQALHEHVEDTR